MSKATSELASTPTKDSQAALSFKKQTAKKAKKEPEQYIFRLIQEHPKAYEGASIFPPRFTIANKDTVLFNYGTEEEPNYMPRQSRYLDGYNTIWVDEQEEKGVVPDVVVNSPKNIITFENGHIIVQSWNKTLYNFLITSNQCEQQVRKVKSVNNVFKLLDFHNSDENMVEIGKKKDMAYDIARSSEPSEMIPHAKFLGISFIHPSTGEERDLEAIREDYKARALANPEEFLLYANNPKVKVIYLVQKALESNVINTETIKGQVHWTATKQMIAPIVTNKKPVDAVVDYALSDEGEAFIRTLKTLVS